MAEMERLRKHANLYRRGGGLIPPAEVVVSWPAPNHINPERHGDEAPILIIVVLGLSILTYMARMWARTVATKNAGVDDWIMTAAMIPLIGSTVVVYLACEVYGYQWHAWDQTAETLITTRQTILAIEVGYLACTSLIKISILCFYKRIASGSITNTFVYWIWGSIAFVIVYFFVFTFSIVFVCSPIEGYWHYFDIQWRITHELKCHNEAAQIVAVVIVSTLQDFFICALPVVLIWNLQISPRQKAALCGIFGLGLLTCVCGVMRAYYATYVYYYTYDITWYAWYGWIWTTLEAQLGVICACAPALKGFFKRYFSVSTNRSGYASNQQTIKGKNSGYGKMTPDNSVNTTRSNTTKSNTWEEEVVPMGSIKVSTTTDVAEDTDDAISQSSSTKNLTTVPVTALPLAPLEDARHSVTNVWGGNRTVITAHPQDLDFDVEKYA